MDEYSNNHQFTENKASIDKLNITIGTWTLIAMELNVSEFISYLGDINAHLELGYPAAFEYHRLLDTVRGTRSFKTRKTRNNQAERPLFSGKLKVRHIRMERTSGLNRQRVELSLDLNLNISRFLQHQTWRPRGGEILPQSCNIFTRADVDESPSQCDEYTLDRNDNLMFSMAARDRGHGDRLLQFIALYIMEIENFMERELEQLFASDGNVHYYHTRFYNIKDIETYWELASYRPREIVRDLAATLRKLSNHFGQTEYPVISENHTYSSPSIWCQLTTHRKLKVYAKTNKRIRFEVSSNIKYDSGLPTTIHTFDNLEALIDSINTYRAELTGSINQSLLAAQDIAEHNVNIREKLSAFVTTIYRKADNVEQANDLISELICFGGTARAGKTQEQLNFLNRLSRSGILVHHTRPRSRFVLAPEYSVIVDNIAQYAENV